MRRRMPKRWRLMIIPENSKPWKKSWRWRGWSSFYRAAQGSCIILEWLLLACFIRRWYFVSGERLLYCMTFLTKMLRIGKQWKRKKLRIGFVAFFCWRCSDSSWSLQFMQGVPGGWIVLFMADTASIYCLFLWELASWNCWNAVIPGKCSDAVWAFPRCCSLSRFGRHYIVNQMSCGASLRQGLIIYRKASILIRYFRSLWKPVYLDFCWWQLYMEAFISAVIGGRISARRRSFFWWNCCSRSVYVENTHGSIMIRITTI